MSFCGSSFFVVITVQYSRQRILINSEFVDISREFVEI